MAHVHKPDFVFRRNGRVTLNRRVRQFSRLLAAEVCASAFIAGSNAGYTMFRGSVKGTGYPLHSPVSSSLPLPYVTLCHHISNGVYHLFFSRAAREPAHDDMCGPLPLKCWTPIMETLDYYRMQSDLGFRISDIVLHASRPCWAVVPMDEGALKG